MCIRFVGTFCCVFTEKKMQNSREIVFLTLVSYHVDDSNELCVEKSEVVLEKRPTKFEARDFVQRSRNCCLSKLQQRNDDVTLTNLSDVRFVGERRLRPMNELRTLGLLTFVHVWIIHKNKFRTKKKMPCQ